MKKTLIVDDELRVRFAKIPSGVHLTVISDSCFSGSVTRLVPELTPDERRARFVPPSVIGRAEIPGVRQVARPRSAEKHPQSKMREVLVTGCRDDQYSYDARIGRQYHGAMTYFATEIIAEANYQLTYAQLWDQLVVRLQQNGYDQEPQVEGKDASKDRLVFT